MRVLKDTPFEFGYMTWQFEPPAITLIVVMKATMQIPLRGVCALSEAQIGCGGETLRAVGDSSALDVDTDFALYKPRGEVHFQGTCHPPAGDRPARASAAQFQLGRIKKTFLVFGDRSWGVLGASDPQPYHSMPLVWERAFGGATALNNPVGQGSAPVSDTQGTRRPLPNIENPAALIRSPGDKPTPWCGAPIARDWLPRVRQVGTYNRAWHTERYPFLPVDFDLAYFNSAPLDQQLNGYWVGDESLVLTNLHPDHRQIETQLPGLRARCGLRFKDGHSEPFRALDLVLDTIAIDADRMQLTCTWRGATRVQSETLDEIDHLFLAHDSIHDLATVEDLRARFEQRFKEQTEDETITADEPPVQPTMVQVLEPFRETLALASLTPESMAESFQKPVGAVNTAEARAKLSDARTRLSEQNTPVPPELDTLERELAMLDRVSRTQRDELRERFVARVNAGEKGFAGENLSGANLTELDLRGLDLSGAQLRNADLQRAQCDGTIFREADLTDANLSDVRAVGAVFASAWLERAIAERCVFDDADFQGANCEGAHFSQSSFRQANCERAEFVGCELLEAVFANANGRDADFSRARLAQSDFSAAFLVDAVFESAQLHRSVFLGADLTRVRASDGADFTEANLSQTKAPQSRWRGAILRSADFSYSELTRADFSQAVLVQANFDCVSARNSVFRQATMTGARMLRADLMEAVFESAELTYADLRGCNLYGAELYKAQLANAKLELANVKQTRLVTEAR